MCFSVAGFHTCTVPSREPEAMCESSGDQDTEKTQYECSRLVYKILPVGSVLRVEDVTSEFGSTGNFSCGESRGITDRGVSIIGGDGSTDVCGSDASGGCETTTSSPCSESGGIT